jgi:hypothetical protein
MNRLNRALIALSVCGGLFVAGHLYAKQANPAQPQTQPLKPVLTGKFTPPIHGTAELQVAPAKSVVKGKIVVTTIEVRNPNQAPIAGLKCDEVWWAKDNSLVPGGGSYRHKQPLQPGERLVITIETEKDSRMFQNRFQFSHAWGQITVKNVKKFQ